jgi:hypothetical protein
MQNRVGNPAFFQNDVAQTMFLRFDGGRKSGRTRADDNNIQDFLITHASK